MDHLVNNKHRANYLTQFGKWSSLAKFYQRFLMVGTDYTYYDYFQNPTIFMLSAEFSKHVCLLKCRHFCVITMFLFIFVKLRYSSGYRMWVFEFFCLFMLVPYYHMRGNYLERVPAKQMDEKRTPNFISVALKHLTLTSQSYPLSKLISMSSKLWKKMYVKYLRRYSRIQ